MRDAISFLPLVPFWLLIAAAIVAGAVFLVAALGNRRGIGWRAMGLALLLVALANPRIADTQQVADKDVALIVIDESPSQALAGRLTGTRRARDDLRTQLEKDENLEVREVRVDGGPDGTRLATAVSRAISLTPDGRFAGAMVLTDGQTHDAEAIETIAAAGPVHVLLTGAPDERDRRVELTHNPAYAIVGAPVTIRYVVRDSDPAPLAVTVRVNGQPFDAAPRSVRPNTPNFLTMTPDRAGPLFIEIEAAAAHDISHANDRAAASLHVVRDRLKVLLISGQPHPGERTWRNLLKADPSVDLIHFTILRAPDKEDFTPLSELALIAFPTRELFEKRLKEFDLVVFDRYPVRGILPPIYFENLNAYVRAGGAMLLATGPEFAGPASLAKTPLKDILPVSPSGRVNEAPFRPTLTDTAARHPITAPLLESAKTWGQWYRWVDAPVRANKGTPAQVLMESIPGAPLLVLQRAGQGRIAVLTSDHVWLWARGAGGGGPHTELLRRLAHWLMKEPSLEEDALSARLDGDELVVTRRSLSPISGDVTVTRPDGATQTISLSDRGPGTAEARFAAAEPGLYHVRHGPLTALAALGDVNAREVRDLRATDTPLGTLAKRSGGGIFWLGRNGETLPELRRVKAGRDAAGRFAGGGGWMGLVRHNATTVSGLTDRPLVAVWLLLAAAALMLLAAWIREGD